MMTRNVSFREVEQEIGKHATRELGQCIRRRTRVTMSLDIAAFILFAAILLLLSCAGVGCGKTLAPEGVYHGDIFLYETDNTIANAKDDLGGFLHWELINRQALAQKGLQSVTKAADSIRVNAPVWFTNATTIRNAYSNSVALRMPAATIAASSNAVVANMTLLQSQTLSVRALTNSVNLQ